MLDEVYLIVYMDAIHLKVRDEHRIVTKATYICLGIDLKEYKDILGYGLTRQKELSSV